ncbi:hypothetical protein J1N35_037794 [Gossypium stocksii]|uniref:Uncharacterized protein n=1 Tax=Gossypium stocksii TaxID=47602 RepID=A0A9D3UL73_9ROSI|nr:hypothetical protein J1N35_037794 [Gossypium stocksii]
MIVWSYRRQVAGGRSTDNDSNNRGRSNTIVVGNVFRADVNVEILKKENRDFKEDMATGSFAETFADIDLDDGNQDLVPIDCDNEEIEEVRTKVSSSGTSKRKSKNAQESVVDEQIKFVSEQLGKIANALEQFIADKTPNIYEKVMLMEVKGFDDDFLCSVFDYLVGH